MAKNKNQSENDDLAKQQEEILKKAEERAKKRAADIAEKNKKNAEQAAIEQAQINENENDIPESNNNETKSNFSSEEQNLNNVDSNEGNFGEQSVDNIDDSENDIPSDVSDEMDIPEEIVSELEEISDINDSQDVEMPNDDFDPLKEKLVKRGYTDGNLGANKDVNQQANGGASNTNVPPVEPVIAEPIINVAPPQDINDINGDKGTGTSKVSAPKPPPVNPKLDDLTAAQKRKAAEKTADALITTYANLVPIPFKKISSFNMRKLERRHMNDELDMNMIIMDDGTRVRDYCEGVNNQAEATFVVTKEMQDEIKDPLIDVLLENNFALTPTQRLVMAVGGQIVQMGITAIQFMQQNSHAIDSFKKFHEENKALKTQESTTVSQESQSEIKPVKEEVRRESPPIKNDIPDEDDIRTKAKSSDSGSDIPDDKEETINEKITVQDFLNEDNK